MRSTAAAEVISDSNSAATPPPDATTAVTARWRLPAQVAVIGTGHLLYGLFNHAFDYLLYPYAVYTLGVIRGGILMTLLSMLQCALTLLVYQRMRIDWVGGSLLDVYAGSAPQSLQARVLTWLTGRQRWLSFAVLCALTDPFIVTAFFRRGRFGALAREDWQLFIASVLLCNLYWIFVADLIARAAVALTEMLVPLFQLMTGVTA
jgi:hypothetical protein